MSVSVQIPYALRSECGGKSEVEVSAGSVRQALTALKDEQPKLYRNVCDETGAVRKHINLFVNESLIHRNDGLETKLGPGDLLFIMTAVSGG
ncbi:Sulfur carrier protein CysO [Bremerella volcania]|uniref:Sulfur carrier protein CysO n=1 Tax=Bremerella volcania TaxID=2527984 RepID=A0A518CDF3_9BACT|nr:MoaD/ThiS family protein [Bremerella volcania]QDU77257.1 Sulfur carrier protein CysO [Bremerella volcania]